MKIKPKKHFKQTPSGNALNSDDIVEIISKAAEEKKALETTVLDISKQSAVADYFIIISVESTPQMRAVAEEIVGKLENNGISRINVQGTVTSGWLVLDLGSIVVHIMGMKEREYYNLDNLWGQTGITYHA